MYKDGHWTNVLGRTNVQGWTLDDWNLSLAPLGGTQGYMWHALRDLIFLAICLLSFFFYNLSASGDYRHLSFTLCNVSLPRINLVILFSSLSLSSKYPFPKLVHLFNKTSSSGRLKEAYIIKTKFYQAWPLKISYRLLLPHINIELYNLTFPGKRGRSKRMEKNIIENSPKTDAV